jgi:hypothetical protein
MTCTTPINQICIERAISQGSDAVFWLSTGSENGTNHVNAQHGLYPAEISGEISTCLVPL